MRDASRLGFESRVLGKGVTRTYALESLVISWFLRGLFVRDVEAMLEETFDKPVSSRSTVSRILEDTRERYRRWCRRRQDEHDLIYLFCDAIYLKLHPDDTPAEGVLVAWGVTREGRKVLLGLQLGSRESYESWLSFGRDLVARGLHTPALIVADGAPGLWKAMRELWPAGRRAALHASETSPRSCPSVTTASSRRAGGRSSTRPPPRPRRAGGWRASSPITGRPTRRRWRSSSATSRRSSPTCAGPPSKRIRTTNLLERTFVEVRRRTKVIDRPLPRRDLRTVADLGRARAVKPRLARGDDDAQDRRRN